MHTKVNFNNYDSFDLAIALYHFLQHNWVGQGDQLYADFCALTAPHMLEVRGSLEYFDKIDDMARMAYDEMTVENYTDALKIVMGEEYAKAN